MKKIMVKSGRLSSSSFPKLALAAFLAWGALTFSSEEPVRADTTPFNFQTTFLSDTKTASETLSRVQNASRSAAEAAALEGTRRQTALLIDGSYDFHYEDDADLKPYVGGSLGLAGAGSETSATATPIARLGGGVAYRLDQGWDLSLDYKAGFAGRLNANDYVTGRGQRPIDLQSLNLGMKVTF
jgi:hypothetical protein